MNDVFHFYLPMDFKPIGATTGRAGAGRSDVTVTYDSYGIPHIKGTTRAGLMYGAGWVTARDRSLLFNFGREPARAAVADIPGLDAFSLVTSATPFTRARSPRPWSPSSGRRSPRRTAPTAGRCSPT